MRSTVIESDMTDSTVQSCARCVLTGAIPNITFDERSICSVCREYEASAEVYTRYFKSEGDLRDLLKRVHEQRRSPYDVLLMYSGGKDSTYVLYRLVKEFNVDIMALTFDNGYLPAGCFENIEHVCKDLGVESVIVSVPKQKMDEAFAIGLQTHASVCGPCFRGLSAKGTELALSKGIPVVMTGLSRGQIFNAKVHNLVSNGVTDPDDIEQYLSKFREMFHTTRDRTRELVEDTVGDNLDGFRDIQFIDFFRYSAVTKPEIVDYLKQQAPFWRKPANVGGCSSNCMINDVGVKVHMDKRGYHNYALPTAWEVRFGHLTRDEALSELNTGIDLRRVDTLLRKLRRY